MTPVSDAPAGAGPDTPADAGPESTQVAPLLVFGWGNLSRGDDALGPLFIERLRGLCEQRDLVLGQPKSVGLPVSEASRRQTHDATLASQVDFLDDYQLQIEHALDLVGRRQVLFVDASLSCAAPFEVTQLQPLQDASFTTHAMSPQALMQVYRDLHGQAPPPCTLLAIRGERFELGEPPGAEALAHLTAALQWAEGWLLQRLKPPFVPA